MANCEQCNQTFAAVRDWQRFCSTTCQQAWNRHQYRLRAVELAEDRAWLRKQIGVEVKKSDLVKRLVKSEPIIRKRLP